MEGLFYGIGVAVVFYGGFILFANSVNEMSERNKARKERKRKK